MDGGMQCFVLSEFHVPVTITHRDNGLRMVQMHNISQIGQTTTSALHGRVCQRFNARPGCTYVSQRGTI